MIKCFELCGKHYELQREQRSFILRNGPVIIERFTARNFQEASIYAEEFILKDGDFRNVKK